jgi:hypothetical protein
MDLTKPKEFSTGNTPAFGRNYTDQLNKFGITYVIKGAFLLEGAFFMQYDQRHNISSGISFFLRYFQVYLTKGLYHLLNIKT